MINEKIYSISGTEVSEEMSSKRHDEEKSISSIVPEPSYWNGLHAVTIIATSCLAMSVLALIPRHDSILEQRYWFEINIPVGIGMIIKTSLAVLDIFILIEDKSLVSKMIFLKIFLASFFTWLTFYCTCYAIWTMILDYNHPMPFVGLLCFIPTTVVTASSLIILFPSKFLNAKSFKETSINYLLYRLSWIIVIIIKLLLTKIFKKLETTDAQCIMALLVPLSKRFVRSIMSKIMFRMVGTENERANVSLTVSLNLSYGLFVALFLVGARSSTVFCLVTVDILMQMNMTYQIVQLHKKIATLGNQQSRIDKRKAILKLLLSELCEWLVPLAYAICFAMAYYGPNAYLLGNVRNGYWQFKAVQNTSWTFLVMLCLFAMDICCLLINSSVIWIFCKVNMFKEFCILMQKFWYIMALKLTMEIYFKFLANDVNLAYDATTKFAWISSDKSFTTISNSTEI